VAPSNDDNQNNAAAALKHLIERRDALIKSLIFAQQDEQLEAHMDLILRIQRVIEIIERLTREGGQSS